MESIRSTINFFYEDKLIRKSSFHYIIPAIIGLVFGQLSPVIGGICISASLGEVPFSALSTVEPVNLILVHRHQQALRGYDIHRIHVCRNLLRLF